MAKPLSTLLRVALVTFAAACFAFQRAIFTAAVLLFFGLRCLDDGEGGGEVNDSGGEERPDEASSPSSGGSGGSEDRRGSWASPSSFSSSTVRWGDERSEESMPVGQPKSSDEDSCCGRVEARRARSTSASVSSSAPDSSTLLLGCGADEIGNGDVGGLDGGLRLAALERVCWAYEGTGGRDGVERELPIVENCDEGEVRCGTEQCVRLADIAHYMVTCGLMRHAIICFVGKASDALLPQTLDAASLRQEATTTPLSLKARQICSGCASILEPDE